MRDIKASAEVRAALGQEHLRELARDPFAKYACWRCQRPGRTTGPTLVTVLGYRSTPVVRLAHATCLDSQVIPLADDGPDDMSAFGSGEMNSKTALLEFETPPWFRSLLVLEPRVELSTFAPGGERVNLWMSGLLEAGMTLMPTGSQLPEWADGWRLELPDSTSATLANPAGGIVYDGECSQPGHWLEVIGEVGGCVVLIGTFGLFVVPDDEYTAARFKNMLNDAARAGALVGGLVDTYHDGSPVH